MTFLVCSSNCRTWAILNQDEKGSGTGGGSKPRSYYLQTKHIGAEEVGLRKREEKKKKKKKKEKERKEEKEKSTLVHRRK